MDYWATVVLRLIWAFGSFTKQARIMFVIALVTGIIPILELVHRWVMYTQVKKFEASGFDWSKRKGRIPEFDWKNKTAEEFYQQFAGPRPHPVIMKGFLKNNTKIMKELQFDRLVEKYGEEDVFLSTPEADGVAGKLKDVLRPGFYLHNCETLFRKYPDIYEMFEFEKLDPYSHKKVGYSQIFVGLKGTGAPFHCAPVWNFFYMTDGTKKWYIVDQYDSVLFYPFWPAGRAASISLVIYPDDYSEKACPEFKYCPWYEVETEPGDVFFMPPWWWHGVRNITEKTVGVASRWHTGGIGGANNMMTDEDYGIAPFASWNFLMGAYSWYFLHEILQEPSPSFDEHTSLRERNNRFVVGQRQLSRDPGVTVMGYRVRW